MGRTWAWRLIASNGNIIATDGGQGYEHRLTAGTMGVAVMRGEYADGEVVYDDE